MKQSRGMSLSEAVFSTAAGFVVSLALTAITLPWLGHPITFSENVLLTAIFTVASIARGFAVRRLFEALR